MVEIAPTPEYLAFEEQDWLDARRRTKVWTVRSARHGDALAEIEWSGRWRQYVLRPLGETIWSAGCLAAVNQFIAERMSERRAAAAQGKSAPDHRVPDPPTQTGCDNCEDPRHGFWLGSRVVVIAPMTARLQGVIIGFEQDTAEVLVDGRSYPTRCHTKWLAPE